MRTFSPLNGDPSASTNIYNTRNKKLVITEDTQDIANIPAKYDHHRDDQ